MRAVLNQKFWGLYAGSYDVLSRLQPYDDMMRDVVSSLSIDPGDRWLDAGCGTGNLIAMKTRSENGTHASTARLIVGLDFTSAMLHRATDKIIVSQFVQARLDRRLPLTDSSFHSLTCVNVLYALPQPHQTLDEFHRVLTPCGHLTLVNPKRSVSPWRIFWEHLRSARWSSRLALLFHLPALVWVGVCNIVVLSGGRRRQLFFPSADELKSLLERAGFDNVRVTETYARQAWLIFGVRR